MFMIDEKGPQKMYQPFKDIVRLKVLRYYISYFLGLII